MEIKQQIDVRATPDEIYDTLMSSEKFAAFTDAAAEIDPSVGGKFSCFDGQITGTQLENIAGELIVQSWRVSFWPEGVFSNVRIELSASEDGTTLSLTHSDFPADMLEHLEPGWHHKYWDPLKAYFA
jgi:activator of HSP90 ATPase